MISEDPNTDNLSAHRIHRRISAIRKFPFGCGRNARELTPKERQNYFSSSTIKVANDSIPSSEPNDLDERCLSKSVSELKPPSLLPSTEASSADDLSAHGISRRVSAIRKFPFGSGRNAGELIAEECRNDLHSQKKKVGDDLRPLSAGEAMRKDESFVYDQTTQKEHVSRKDLARSASPTKFTPRPKVTLTSKSLSSSGQSAVFRTSGSGETEINDLDYFRGKEIISALMAVPYCPWMNGKRVPIPCKLGDS